MMSTYQSGHLLPKLVKSAARAAITLVAAVGLLAQTYVGKDVHFVSQAGSSKFARAARH